MRGKYRVVVKNKRLHYEFEIKRNITIIKGDSATGKTNLIFYSSTEGAVYKTLGVE